MISRKTLNAMLVSAVAMTISSAAIAADGHDAPEGKEKCYGVVKASMNDCASASGSHMCAGSATANGSGEEWVAVPKGLCTKLVNGSLTPVSTNGAPAAPAAAPQAPSGPAAQ